MRFKSEYGTDTNKRLLNIREAAAYIGLGVTNSRIWLDSIGAKKKIGARALYDRVIIDEAIDRYESEV